MTEAQPSRLPALFKGLSDLFSFLIAAFGVAWALDAPSWVGLMVFKEQYISVMLGLGLAVAFLGREQESGALRLANAAAAAVCLAAGLYLAFDYQALLMEMARKTPSVIALGAVLLTAIIICVRRVAGLFLLGVMLVFLLQTLFAGELPELIQGRSVKWDRLLAYLAVDPTATLGMPLAVSCTIVITFILFGMMIARTGGGDFFTDLAMQSVGRYRGGAAKVAVTGSALFGSVSGSAVANIVATGVVTIPLMKRAGYRPEQAGAIEAVASTGGQLLPPIMGAAAFLMAEFLQITYGEVLLAALLPGLLYYAAVIIYTDLVAARDSISAVDTRAAGEPRPLMARALIYVTPFVVLLVAMFAYSVRPELAALYACLTLLLARTLTAEGRAAVSPRALIALGIATGRAMVEIIVIAAAAGIIIGAINLSGSAFALSLLLLKIGAGSLIPVLVVTGIVSIILGMGMPTVGVYVLLATLAAPAIVELGVAPLAAHLFVLYFGMMSMITPPVAIASYVAASVAGGEPVKTGFEAMRVGWVAYLVPFLFVFSPSLLLQGNLLETLLALVTALVGIVLVSAALIGHLTGPLNGPMRLFAAAAGLSLFVPADAFAGAWLSEVAGLIGLALIAFIARRKPGGAGAA